MTVSSKLINWSELFERCMSDAEFATQLLDVFIDSAPRTLTALKQSLTANHVSDSRRHAHTLKGSAGNLAIESLRSLSASAEKLAGSGDLSSVNQLIPKLDQLLNSSIAEAHSIKQQLLATAA